MKRILMLLMVIGLSAVGCTTIYSHEVFPIKDNLYLMSFVYKSPSWDELTVTQLMEQKATEFCPNYKKVCDFYGLKRSGLKARFWGFECLSREQK
jgi:hypothetical protein